jgi:hypothetical protein
MSAPTAHEVIVLGRDAVGVVAEGYGMRYYLTDCCGASAKGLEHYVGCRACYREVDPALGGIPDGRVTFVDGQVEIERLPFALIEVYGDGLPYDVWKAQR